MKLYLAEKPSLGRAIAAALPKPHRKGDGCIYVGSHDANQCDVVSWCIGHVLEQAEPDAYDKRYKKWLSEDLPILPDQFSSGWKLTPKPQTRKQFSILKKLIKQADQIVHCGDPDREGQLLVDEVLNHVGISTQVQASLQRCLINDLNLPAVKQSLAQLTPNKEFAALSISALARSRADWLYGMNLTRAYTLQAQKVGFKGVVSIGRVQTPVLGLVVRRDIEIDNFTPVPFFEVTAHIQAEPNFSAKWQPSEACQAYLDEEGRVLNKALAENVIRRINGQSALVTKVEDKPKKLAPPLPFSLSSLQIDAAKCFGMSAKVVLDVCQNLYETHKLITYPRSDNRYLPSGHFVQAADVVSAIAINSVSKGAKSSEMKVYCDQADTSLKSKAWNDKKVSAHHAIIPTANTAKQGLLSSAEQQIYQLISKQYLCQFYPAWAYNDGVIELEIAGGKFIAKERTTISLGWKQLFKRSSNDAQPYFKSLPSLSVGQTLLCERGELLEKLTQAAKHFTDATLLAAMTGIARFVSNPEIKKILKETDGLGTEATRANIIELLFKRRFLQRQGKLIKATEAGRGVINSLPNELSYPDMTAEWESALNNISLKKTHYPEFMLPLKNQITQLIDQARNQIPNALKGIKQSRTFSKTKRKRLIKS